MTGKGIPVTQVDMSIMMLQRQKKLVCWELQVKGMSGQAVRDWIGLVPIRHAYNRQTT